LFRKQTGTIAVIAGGRGVEIVIATTGAGIEKTGMTAAEVVTTGVTGIAMIGTIGADVVGVQREWAGTINRLSQAGNQWNHFLPWSRR
jgi:hypothetical protein